MFDNLTEMYSLLLNYCSVMTLYAASVRVTPMTSFFPPLPVAVGCLQQQMHLAPQAKLL